MQEAARAFQLKAYNGSDNADELFDFIVSRLKKYGFNLGEINLFITLRCGGDIANLKLEELHEKLKVVGVKGTGHILISYNEGNTTEVIVTAYPTLGSTRIPHKKFSDFDY